MALDEKAERRIKLVSEVYARFADHGADRAAILTLAFFVTDIAVEVEGVAVAIERADRK